MLFQPKDYFDLVRPLIEGRKFILAVAPVAASGGAARKLRDFGAEGVLILGHRIGTGGDIAGRRLRR